MGTDQRFAAAVIYVDDVPAAVGFYRRVTGLSVAHYDEGLGFAVLGEGQHLSIASHAAGAFMLGDGYTAAHGRRVQGVELAFWSDDVAADYENALAAGARPLTPPRVMPWGQTVSYVEAPEGTILGFVSRVEP